MPGAALVGAALNTHASRAFGLWVGGVDVIADPVAPPDYWVPIDSVHVQEAGPGNVSSMDFVIECSGISPLVVGDGMDVRFWNLNATNQYPIFLGWIDHVDIENMPGDVATRYQVACTGIEAVLDWSLITSDMTIPAATTPESAVLACVGNATGNALGWLSALVNGNLTGSSDYIAGGVADGIAPSLNAAVVITAGTTLRAAILQVAGQVTIVNGATSPQIPINVSVGMYGYLLFFTYLSTAHFNAITLDDDPPLSASPPAENLKYGIDASQVRGVIVKGTGVTAFVGDGSGKPGAVALVSDTTITTTAAAQSAGTAYLTQYASQIRGSFEQQDWAPTVLSVQRPGGAVHIGDARVAPVNIDAMITGIDKTWNPSQRENWLVSFGGNPPSVTALTRQLTRGTLS